MACSAVLLAKRSLVALLLRLAVAYHVVISINRDAADVKVTEAFRKVVLKVHPDKGGKVADAQELQGAKAKWEEARRDASKNSKKGRPKEAHNQGGRRAPKTPADNVVVAGEGAATRG
jgi:curved DNA-binding protein CbpA